MGQMAQPMPVQSRGGFGGYTGGFQGFSRQRMPQPQMLRGPGFGFGNRGGPSRGIKISTNFGGQRTLHRGGFSYAMTARRPLGGQGKPEHFLADIANQYGISRSQLMNIFDQVSKSRNDLLEYVQSNG